jgi:2-keto-3-deoxy-6-phosphogluconate aldolase
MNTIGGVNQQQAQAYGDTGAGAMNLAGDIVTEPDVAAELAIRGVLGFGVGGALMSNEVGAAENPDFFQQLQRKRVY